MTLKNPDIFHVSKAYPDFILRLPSFKYKNILLQSFVSSAAKLKEYN